MPVLTIIAGPNPELTIERVKTRIGKGGHSLSESTIRDRFTTGLKLLDENFGRFDLVSMHNSVPKDVSLSFVMDPEEDVMMTFNMMPKSLTPWLPKLLDRPLLNRALDF